MSSSNIDLGDLKDIFGKDKAIQMPLDVMAQQQKLARRQKLVDALTGSALTQTPTQMVGRVAVRQSPFDALGKTLMGGVAGYQQKDIDQSMEKIATDYNNNVRQSITDALAKPEDEAIRQLMSSPTPQVQAIGTAMQKQKADRTKAFGEKAMEGLTNKGKQQAAVTGTLNGAQTAADKAYDYNPEHVQIDPQTGQPLEAMKGVITQGVTQNGSPVNIAPSGAQTAIDKAPKVNVGVAQYGPKEGVGAYFKKAGEDLAAEGKAIQDSAANMKIVDEMERLDKAGMFNGFGANQVATVAKAGKAVGLNIDASKLGNTEAYRSAQTGLWQGLISKMGGNRGVTKEEAEEIKQILPQVSDSPAGRQRIIEILRNAHARNVAQHKRMSGLFGKALSSNDPSEYINARAEAIGEIPGVETVPASPPASGQKVKSWNSF